MTEFSFYHFKDITYKHQPYQSNWCWAACLSNMISGLNGNSKIGESQCNLMSYYKAYLNNNSQLRIYDSCCTSYQNTSTLCNVRIDDDHLEKVYEAGGFTLEEKEVNKVYDYSWVKNKLIKNQSPILLKILINGGSHANLITGYGEINSCKYLLVSDPIKTTGESYVNINKFSNLFDISTVWITKRSNNDKIKLIEDEEISQRFNKVKSLIKNVKQLQSYEFKNPMNYIGFEYPNIIDNILTKGRINKKISFRLFLQLKESFKNQRLDGQCEPRVHKKSSDGNIIGIKYEDLENPSEETIDIIKNFPCKTYVQEYAIELKLHVFLSKEYDTLKLFDFDNNINIALAYKTIGLNDDIKAEQANGYIGFSEENFRIRNKNNQPIILVKPTSYPNNYDLNENFQTLENFKTSLNDFQDAFFFRERGKTLSI